MKNCLAVYLVLLLSLSYTTFSFAANLTTEDFSQLPDVSRLVLSPDGKKLASTIRISVDNTQGIAVQVTDLETKEKKISLFTDNSQYFLKWIAWKDNKTLMVSTFAPSERDTQIGMQIVRLKT